MPLLHKAPYQFRSVPQDLKDDDEVFHIRATKEVFKTYEYPFEMLHCNNFLFKNFYHISFKIFNVYNHENLFVNPFIIVCVTVNLPTLTDRTVNFL